MVALWSPGHILSFCWAPLSLSLNSWIDWHTMPFHNRTPIVIQGGKNEPPPSGDAFVCNNFTLSAPKQTLFDNVGQPIFNHIHWAARLSNSDQSRSGLSITKASVTIVQGHRYGILGPNGQVGWAIHHRCYFYLHWKYGLFCWGWSKEQFDLTLDTCSFVRDREYRVWRFHPRLWCCGRV